MAQTEKPIEISDEYPIESIEDLLNSIKIMKHQVKRRKRGLGDDALPEEELWYRGHSDHTWELIPSLAREYVINSDDERALVNNFRMRASQIMENAPAKNDYSSWMALMQHYGLATRLLDWSKSPLTSLYFALFNYESLPETDACVWVLRPERLNTNQIFTDKIYPCDATTVEEMLEPAFKEPYWDKEKEELLRRAYAAQGGADERRFRPLGKDKIVACYSVENNLRMYSQQACYTVHNTRTRLDEIPVHHLLTKLRIPARCRASMWQDLKNLGITESFIFPDLDHLSKDILLQYSSKKKQ